MTYSHEEVDVLYIGFVLGHGGDALQMLHLAAEVARRGVRVKIVVPDLDTTLDLVERGRECDVRVERSAWIRADQYNARQNLLNLLRIFRENRAPLLHLHTGDVCLPRLVLLAMNLLHMPPALVTIQSPYETVHPGDARARHWAAAATHQFYKIVCPSEHSRRTQISYGLPPERVQTIRNSVDLDRFRRGDGPAARRDLHLPDDRRLVVFSSRLEPQKRPLDAIHAFHGVAAEFPDTDLIFVGSGTLENEAKSLAQQMGLGGRIHFMGYRNDVPDWLAAASAWLLPTESENFSLAVLEALAAGCPVVSTLCPGNDEVLVDGVNALTTVVGDVQGIAAALRRVLSDPALCRRLSERARQTVEAYSLEKMTDQYSRCYNECLGILPKLFLETAG